MLDHGEGGKEVISTEEMAGADDKVQSTTCCGRCHGLSPAPPPPGAEEVLEEKGAPSPGQVWPPPCP